MRPAGVGARAAAAVLACLLGVAGCARTSVRDYVGLWAETDPADAEDGALDLDVVFVTSELDGGCWSAVEQGGAATDALPVSWPVGTRLGLDAVLELPDGTVVADGDVLLADGGYRDGAGAVDPPSGCDVSRGFWAVASASVVEVG